jgi:hypothetical protein
MTTDDDEYDQPKLRQFKRDFFGLSHEDPSMPSLYLIELRRLIAKAHTTLGVRNGSRERTGYWIDGASLGWFTSTGATDEDVQMSGAVVRLDAITCGDLAVHVERGGPFRDEVSWWARKLTFETPRGEVLLDATQGTEEHRAKVNEFIAAMLAALAGRSRRVHARG